MQVADGNGAGIRIRAGDLDVVQAMFVDGQCGILSATDPNGTISVDHSTFSRFGKEPDGNGAHRMYIGHYGAVPGHQFALRARDRRPLSQEPLAPDRGIGSSFDDSQGRTQLHDRPAGAVGRIAGNISSKATARRITPH